MIRLLKSENMKIYARTNTLVMVALLLLATFLAVAAEGFFSTVDLNYWTTVVGQSWVMILIKFFAVIVAGGIVANEFSWGTIKLLLIRPVGRGRILCAKYLAVVMFILALMLLLLLTLMLVNAAVLALEGGAAGKPGMYRSFGDVLAFYLLRTVDILVYAAIAFTLSVLTKSHTFSVGAGFLLIALGPESADTIAGRSWAKYYLFSHTGLVLLDGTPGFSLMVIGIYLALFYAVAWVFFTRKDVLS